MCLFVALKEMCLASIFPALYTWTLKHAWQKKYLRCNCILLVTPLDLHLFEGRLILKWKTGWDSRLCLQTARTFWDHEEGRECYLSTPLLSPDPPLPLPSCRTRLFSEMKLCDFCCRQLVELQVNCCFLPCLYFRWVHKINNGGY